MNPTKPGDAIVFNARYDRVWRMLGAYIVYLLCNIAMGAATFEKLDFITPWVREAAIQWRQAVFLLCLVGIYRLFFGPLVPRIREVWGRVRVKLPVSLIVAGILLFALMILKKLSFFGQGPSTPVQTPLMSLLLLPMGLSLTLFADYGIIYRLFARMRMSFALLAASLFILFPFIIIVGAALWTEQVTMYKLPYYFTTATLLVLEACWGLYIYKRYNSLTPAAILMVTSGLVFEIIELAS